MYPNLKEMLFSMRECDSDDEEEEEYIEIGQYEYILNQDISFEQIENYLKLYRERRQTATLSKRGCPISQEFISEYEQFHPQRIQTVSLTVQ